MEDFSGEVASSNLFLYKGDPLAAVLRLDRKEANRNGEIRTPHCSILVRSYRILEKGIGYSTGRSELI